MHRISLRGALGARKPTTMRFLDMAFAAARELEYHVFLAQRLGYLKPELAQELQSRCEETCRVLSGLLRSLRELAP